MVITSETEGKIWDFFYFENQDEQNGQNVPNYIFYKQREDSFVSFRTIFKEESLSIDMSLQTSIPKLVGDIFYFPFLRPYKPVFNLEVKPKGGNDYKFNIYKYEDGNKNLIYEGIHLEVVAP